MDAATFNTLAISFALANLTVVVINLIATWLLCTMVDAIAYAKNIKRPLKKVRITLIVFGALILYVLTVFLANLIGDSLHTTMVIKGAVYIGTIAASALGYRLLMHGGHRGWTQILDFSQVGTATE